jgi:hypothetical protein
MPIYRFVCPNHQEEELYEIKQYFDGTPKPEETPICPICGSNTERQLSQVAVTTVKALVNRDTGARRDIKWDEAIDKRVKDHFANQGIHEIIEDGRGKLPIDKAKQNGVFVKEGGRFRVRKKEDNK